VSWHGEKTQSSFNPSAFLADADNGRSITKFRKNQIVFSQGEPADAVFFVQKGKVRVSVVSDRGREAVVSVLGPMNFSVKAACRARPSAQQQLMP